VTKPASTTIRTLARDNCRDLLFLVVLDWVAHFWHFRRFGLYQDDWYFNTGPWAWATSDWFDAMFRQMREFVFGRPLEILLLYVNGYIGSALESIEVLYVIAYLYSAAVTVLLYLVLRNRFSREFALLGAAFFVLSPLTSVRQFLNTAYKMAPAYALVLGAMLLYFRRWRALSYAVAAVSLITYEWLYPLFIGAPLLEPGGRLFSRRMAVHALVCVLILAAAVGIRSGLQESRMAAELPSDPGTLIGGVTRVTAIHILNIPLLLVSGSYLAFANFTWESLLLGLAVAALLLWLLRRGEEDGIDGGEGWNAVRAGCCFVVLGLSFSYLVAPNLQFGEYWVLGRITRVFGPAELGAAITLAGTWSVLREVVPFRRIVIAGLGAFLAVLVMVQIAIQHDYIKAWDDHRELIAGIIELTPDVEPETTVVVSLLPRAHRLFENGPRPRAIGDEKEMFQRVLYFLHRHGEPVPNLYFSYNDRWRQHLALREDGKLHWKAAFVPDLVAFEHPPLTPGKVIRIRELESGRYVRDDEPILAGETPLTQPPRETAESAWDGFRRSALFDAVFPSGINGWTAGTGR